MFKLSESVFYGISNATKSDSSFLKLNNGATKRFLRVTIPTKKCARRQNSSKKKMLYNPSSSTPDNPLNYESNSKKVKLEYTPLCHDTSELSDYEKQIQNNIAERMKFLENLNIFDAKKSLEESIELTRTKPKPQIKEKIENKTSIMIRKSLRLQHLEAENVEIYSEFHKKEIIRPSPD